MLISIIFVVAFLSELACSSFLLSEVKFLVHLAYKCSRDPYTWNYVKPSWN